MHSPNLRGKNHAAFDVASSGASSGSYVAVSAAALGSSAFAVFFAAADPAAIEPVPPGFQVQRQAAALWASPKDGWKAGTATAPLAHPSTWRSNADSRNGSNSKKGTHHSQTKAPTLRTRRIALLLLVTCTSSAYILYRDYSIVWHSGFRYQGSWVLVAWRDAVGPIADSKRRSAFEGVPVKT